MLQSIKSETEEARSRASIMNILHTMTETLDAFVEGSMLSVTELDASSAAGTALATLIQQWPVEVEIERVLAQDGGVTAPPIRFKERTGTRSKRRAANRLV